MNSKMFFIIVAGAFGLASVWHLIANPTLGNCDCEETREWDAGLQAEACEPGYSLHEACEFASGINSDCGLGLTPSQIQTLKAQTYAAAIRLKNSKIKGVDGVAINLPNYQANFEESVASAQDRHDELTAEGRLEDDLAEVLDTASVQIESLPFGEVDDGLDLAAIAGTVEQLAEFGEATNDRDVTYLINSYCLELESYMAFATGMEDFAEADGDATLRMVGHLTNPTGNFKTDILMSNSSGETRPYTLRAYNAQGQMVEELHGEIGKRQILTFYPAEMFTAKDVSHFTIMEGESLEVTAKYRSKDQGGSVFIKESARPSNRWRIFPGEWDKVWDGIAIVNTGHRAASVTIRQLDSEDQLIQEIALDRLNNLPSMGKGLVVLSDLGFTQVQGSQFQIVATQPITLTALRGTKHTQETFMWESTAFAD